MKNFFAIVLLIAAVFRSASLRRPHTRYQTAPIADSHSASDSEASALSDSAKDSTGESVKDSAGDLAKDSEGDSAMDSSGYLIARDIVKDSAGEPDGGGPTPIPVHDVKIPDDVCNRNKCDIVCNFKKFLEGKCMDNVCWCIKKD